MTKQTQDRTIKIPKSQYKNDCDPCKSYYIDCRFTPVGKCKIFKRFFFFHTKLHDRGGYGDLYDYNFERCKKCKKHTEKTKEQQ